MCPRHSGHSVFCSTSPSLTTRVPKAIRKSADELDAWDAEQPAFREKCRSLLKEAPELAEELLSAYTEAQAQKAWDWAWKMVEQLGEERILKNSSTRYLPPENV